MQTIPAFPLCWPDRFPRTKPAARQSSTFKATLPQALANVKKSLELFGKDSGKKVEGIVMSSNVTLGADRPTDPGVAVWFSWDGLQVCIPVDRYSVVATNLQAIHHVLEARRTELRHGGFEIAKATFTGFLALPAPRKRDWWEVMGIARESSPEMIRDRYKVLARTTHPDTGGSADAFAELGDAYKAAKLERGEA